MKGCKYEFIRQGMRICVCLLLATACSYDDGPAGTEAAREKDCEVSVAVTLDAPLLRGMGDPGAPPEEDAAEWDRLDLFLVYDWGMVLQHTLTSGQLEAGNPNTFNAFAGKLKGLYGVAYKTVAGAAAVTASSEEEVKGLRTANLGGMAVGDKLDYMLSLSSGKVLPSDADPMEIKKDATNEFRVRLTRLITKVDVQWDVQDAYASGEYTRVRMNGIEFFGLDNGLFFPENETRSLPDISAGSQVEGIYTTAYVADAPVSQRNGRTYFYTFPGVANKLRFVVDYSTAGTPSGRKTYVAVFQDKLERSTWHKVNFTVKGNTFTGSGGITLTPSVAVTDY